MTMQKNKTKKKKTIAEDEKLVWMQKLLLPDSAKWEAEGLGTQN